MKSILFYFFLVVSAPSFAQDNESLSAHFGFGFSLTPITGYSIENSKGVETIISGGAVYVDPKYSVVKEYQLRYNVHAQGNFHFPVVTDKQGYSMAIEFQPAAGFHMGTFGAEGIASFSFAATLNAAVEIDKLLGGTRFLLGYRYNYCGLPYGVPILGVDFDGLSFYCSVRQDRYYRYLSNGDYTPAIKIREIGMNIFF